MKGKTKKQKNDEKKRKNLKKPLDKRVKQC